MSIRNKKVISYPQYKKLSSIAQKNMPQENYISFDKSLCRIVEKEETADKIFLLIGLSVENNELKYALTRQLNNMLLLNTLAKKLYYEFCGRYQQITNICTFEELEALIYFLRESKYNLKYELDSKEYRDYLDTIVKLDELQEMYKNEKAYTTPKCRVDIIYERIKPSIMFDILKNSIFN